MLPLFQETEFPVLVLPAVPELDTDAVPSLTFPETLADPEA